MRTKAVLIKILEGFSAKDGGTFNVLCFKDLNTGKSAKTFIASNCRNRERWQPVIKKGKGCIIENFIYRSKSTIDGDSQFVITGHQKEDPRWVEKEVEAYNDRFK